MSYHPSARCHENWTRRLAVRHRWLMTGPVTQLTGCVPSSVRSIPHPPYPRTAPRNRPFTPRDLSGTPHAAHSMAHADRPRASIALVERTIRSLVQGHDRIVSEIVANRSVFALVLILFLIITARLKAAPIRRAHAD
ncbi:hypothetical protein RR48_14034 [Papilio machaon]|uniref:Uncharacterized protein n=1 Tax=Papilio machaon TaxID=76193 RepID=A0A194QMV5_PAPMA|nr:hypothetical protein RR48_14034 [Papilio machaon]